ncbi:MAG: ABC transporter substrate-binding protein [Alphaproteobacteria bacterium]|jgi:polar amino acid transport system substrate-binding protein|nr:ABC transporter substrate-binding protein [Alphaproteobacteria bacterium]MBT4017027.1 ABC transporter substrate-binding protein [Alphaproteobacteria bacterium]MBT5160963.1 ABC transporter substrate-binding protein [Alphaproteobacteria bacterium]MBT5917981.1 ABC transporter substrate-binding protein [Alphaproteobacteria bacterium]MBT6387712.1 ABC transporter substrate-binding protein [Alphaproteobacteria bacterium]
MRIIKTIFAAATLLLLSVLPGHAQTRLLPQFEIMTEDWSPYQFTRDGVLVGISTDIVVELLKAVGSKQDRKDIIMYPWARGYKTLQKRPNAALFLTTKTHERASQFKWVGPIFTNTTYLIAKKFRSIKINHSGEVKSFRIGAVIDDVSVEYLNELGVPREKLTLNRASEFNLRMMAIDRIDLVIDNWDNFLANAKMTGINPDLYERVYVVRADEVGIAFNRAVPDWVISRLQKALDDLRAKGVIDDLFKKYGLVPESQR